MFLEGPGGAQGGPGEEKIRKNRKIEKVKNEEK